MCVGLAHTHTVSFRGAWAALPWEIVFQMHVTCAGQFCCYFPSGMSALLLPGLLLPGHCGNHTPLGRLALPQRCGPGCLRTRTATERRCNLSVPVLQRHAVVGKTSHDSRQPKTHTKHETWRPNVRQQHAAEAHKQAKSCSIRV